MPLKDLANLRDEIGFRHGELRGPRFLPFLVVLDGGGGLRAFDQVLERDLALARARPSPG